MMSACEKSQKVKSSAFSIMSSAVAEDSSPIHSPSVSDSRRSASSELCALNNSTRLPMMILPACGNPLSQICAAGNHGMRFIVIHGTRSNLSLYDISSVLTVHGYAPNGSAAPICLPDFLTAASSVSSFSDVPSMVSMPCAVVLFVCVRVILSVIMVFEVLRFRRLGGSVFLGVRGVFVVNIVLNVLVVTNDLNV